MPANGRAASGRREALTAAEWQRLESVVYIVYEAVPASNRALRFVLAVHVVIWGIAALFEIAMVVLRVASH